MFDLRKAAQFVGQERPANNLYSMVRVMEFLSERAKITGVVINKIDTMYSP